MFPVGRYDPASESKSRKMGQKKRPSKKRPRDDGIHVEDQAQGKESTLHVIAPEVADSRPPGIRNEEGFDDFDIDELIDGDGAQSNTDAKGVPDSEQQKETEPAVTGDLTAREVQMAMRMASMPITDAAKEWDLAGFLIDNLKADGFERFFPIQALTIPDVLASERRAHIRCRDICISAPTGSGKTLAYVLPILSSLSQRNVVRLRALVVLPSRDLAIQVHKVFQRYMRGSDLRVGLAIGQTDFRAEQLALTIDDASQSVETARHRLQLEPENSMLALRAYGSSSSTPSSLDGLPSLPNSGRSAVDVLVCTPGRLVDHIDNTPGFTLQHLKFLVVDEADRLLHQRYHNWIERVIHSANEPSMAAHEYMEKHKRKLPELQTANLGASFKLEPITWRRGASRGDFSGFNTNNSFFSAAASVCEPLQLRKFLVSATLTRDPRKLAAMYLVNPMHFDAHQLTRATARGVADRPQYTLPTGLEEFTVQCTAEQKPLVLLALLLERLQSVDGNKIIVVFTASLDSTHRLVRLLQLLWTVSDFGAVNAIAEYSSALSQAERTDLVTRCNSKTGETKVVVCSDGMSRGMDIEDVGTVVNYDVPSFAQTYVHRCGRTARAGRKGMAISLLKGGQVRKFARMRQLIGSHDEVQGMGVQKGLIRDVVPKYRECVRALKALLDAEDNGELNHTDVLLDEYVDED